MARPRRVGPDDQRTLVEHLEELRTRLIIVLSALAVAMTVCYIENVRIYHFLQRPLEGNVKLVTLAPTEAFFNAIMISVYGGLLIENFHWSAVFLINEQHELSQQVVLVRIGLPRGPHLVTIAPSTQKNAYSSGYAVALDAIDTR